MTLTHRLSIATLALLAALGITLGAAWVGYQTAGADVPVLADDGALTDAARADILAESLHRATATLEALADDPANRSTITPDITQYRADLEYTRPILLAQADTGSAGSAMPATPDTGSGAATIPPIASPLDELAALKAKYDALKAAKDSGSKDLLWFAYAALAAAVLRVLLAALTAWRGDKPKGWAKWAALGAAVPIALLTYYAAGAGLWASLVMAGSGPGAIIVNELLKRKAPASS